jgi:death on curing protein
MKRISVADFLLIAQAVTGIPASRLYRIIRLGEASSALAAPFSGFGDTEFYPEPHQKAAILCSRILRNHPLVDGNKRTAWICMREFVMRNGMEWRPPPGGDGEAAEVIERLAAGELSEEAFTEWVRQRLS